MRRIITAALVALSLTACGGAPRATYTPPTQTNIEVEYIGGDIKRVIDRDVGTVCYYFSYGNGKMQCYMIEETRLDR